MKKINIVSTGRFHVLDLAQQLKANGFDVKFYSCLPPSRLRKYNLNNVSSFSFFFTLLPFFLLKKIMNSCHLSFDIFDRVIINTFDFLCAIFQRKCDLFIGMSDICLRSSVSAKNNGSIIFIERGSRHILSQKNILADQPSPFIIPRINIKRELLTYRIADKIVVPSIHAYDSFLEYNVPREKLFLINYGVESSDFYPLNVEKKYDLIMVGRWSYQKGCDCLVNYMESHPELSLLHVGAIGDLPKSQLPNITHVGVVDQKVLVNYYNQSRCFILLSRQEGLALVLVQALACGLPVICSPYTGGIDLCKHVSNSVFIVNSNSPNEISEAYNKTKKIREISFDADVLSWKNYGVKYSNQLKRIME